MDIDVLEPEDLFTLLSSPTRLRCLFLIYKRVELCVCELSYALEISQPKISRHLALLRQMNLVTTRRTGLWVHYRINQNLLSWIYKALETTFDGIQHFTPYHADLMRLSTNEDLANICKVNRAG